MKKKLVFLTLIFVSLCFFTGCLGKNYTKNKGKEVVFSEETFKGELLKSYDSKSTLKVEGRYAIGYMYSESFSTDESGTLTNGLLQLGGRAFDPSDMGDETVLNGRTYQIIKKKSDNMDLDLDNGSVIKDLYMEYFRPLDYPAEKYVFRNIGTNKGRITLEENTVKEETNNGRKVYVFEYIHYSFDGDKKSNIVTNGTITKLKIKSYIDIKDEMNKFIEAEFGGRYALADEINQRLGNDFLKGIYCIEEFKAELK